MMVTLPNYKITRNIGSGSFGILVPLNQTLGYVFEAYDNTTNRRVAIKRIEKCGKS